MKLSMPGPVRDLLEGVRSRNLAGRFGRDAAGTLALRVTFAVCYGVANIFLARILGAADYGSYTFAAAWLTLLGIPTVLGMDRFLVREVATYSVQGAWGQMRGLLRQSNAHVLALSVTTGLLAAAVAWFIPWHSNSTMQVSLWIALIALPFYSLKRALQAALQACNRRGAPGDVDYAGGPHRGHRVGLANFASSSCSVGRRHARTGSRNRVTGCNMAVEAFSSRGSADRYCGTGQTSLGAQLIPFGVLSSVNVI
jgi:hypothetical protein